MASLNKLNHVTYLTNNIAGTVNFYTEVMGMKLVAAERRPLKISDLATAPSVSLGQIDESAFGEQFSVMFEMQNGSRISFAEVEGLKNWPANPLPRWIKHLAMKVGSEEDLVEAKAWFLEKGLDVIGITDHGAFKSLYFFDPVNDIRLEFTYDVNLLDEEDARVAWEALEIWKAGGVPPNRAFS